MRPIKDANPLEIRKEMRSRRKLKTWLVTIFAILGVIGVLAGIWLVHLFTMIRAGKSFVPPPESVTSTKVQAGEWQSIQAAVGTLMAVHGVTLGAELPGVIRHIGFESGTSVK